jgi:ribosomal protein S18 acetylase RimI-like enzyme
VPSTLRIYRAANSDLVAARAIVDAYCDEIGVVVRDTDDAFKTYFVDGAGVWLAARLDDGAVVGCVILRPLPQIAGGCEVKRLYVEAESRGARVAHLLMDALHAYAIVHGYEWVYLDTKDDLHAAIRFYRGLGYTACERYNDNPQATLFMRKRLLP